MERIIFTENKLITYAIVFGIATIATLLFVFMDNIPILVLPVAYLISLFIWITSIRTKVIIENGSLRYERLIGGEEVALQDVAQIVQREVETIVDKNRDGERSRRSGRGMRIGNVRFGDGKPVNEEREVKKIIYVMDEAGRTIFSFPANVIRFSERQRFREIVQKSNPKIRVL